jgi:hypothetical protein
MELTRSSDSECIPYHTRSYTFLLWEGVIQAYGNRILCLYRNPYVLTFYLGLWIGVIRPAFDIYIIFLFGYHMHLFGILLNWEIELYILFILIHIRCPTDNANQSYFDPDACVKLLGYLDPCSLLSYILSYLIVLWGPGHVFHWFWGFSKWSTFIWF